MADYLPAQDLTGQSGELGAGASGRLSNEPTDLGDLLGTEVATTVAIAHERS